MQNSARTQIVAMEPKRGMNSNSGHGLAAQKCHRFGSSQLFFSFFYQISDFFNLFQDTLKEGLKSFKADYNIPESMTIRQWLNEGGEEKNNANILSKFNLRS